MAVGAVLFAVALLDEWVTAVRGGTAARPADAEPQRNE